MYKIILWDLDNTLLDFFSAEAFSLNRRFDENGLGECTVEMARRFDAINNKYWQLLEEEKLTRSEALTQRFAEFFKNEGITFNGSLERFNQAFELGLADEVFFVENSLELVASLKGEFSQYAVTNGAVVVQNKRLQKSGFDKLFDGVFISEGVGFDKPSVEFFNYVFKNIPPCKREEVIIIGDSLTSDMLGGNNANITTCWYNPAGKKNTVGAAINYEIKTLSEILEIIK